MSWQQKINRLKDFDNILKSILPLEVVMQIQYVSIRKDSKRSNLMLIGVNDISVKLQILNVSPRLIIECNNNLNEINNNTYSISEINRIEVFKFDIEEKERKKAELKEIKRLEKEKYNKWASNPKAYLEKTNLPNQVLNANTFIKDGYIFNFDRSKRGFYWNNDIYSAYALLNIYDYIAKDKYNNLWKYIKAFDGSCFKYRDDTKAEIFLSSNIGLFTIEYLDSGKTLKPVSSSTYKKWESLKLNENDLIQEYACKNTKENY